MDDMIVNSTGGLPLTPMEDDKSPEQQSIEREQYQEDYSLAALVDHPGWQQIRDIMVSDIDDFKTFKNIDMSQYNNTELGEVVRTERMVAEKLQGYLNRIDDAVKAVVIANERRDK
jgi:hypothetical protein